MSVVERELPPWPHIEGPRVRVQVSERKFVFGRLINATQPKEPITVLTDGGQVLTGLNKADVQ